MTINGYELDECQIQIFNEIVNKCKSENRRDIDSVFKEIIDKRIIFYNNFNQNFNLNITNIQDYLERF